MSTAPDSSTPGVHVQRRLVEAGLLACVAGVVVHRTWQALPLPRIGETLLLALLWSALAGLLHRVARQRMAVAIAWVGLGALVAMTGLLPVLAAALLALGAIAIGTWFVADAAAAGVIGAAVIAGGVGWTLPLPVHRPWVYAPLLVAASLWRRRALRAALGDASRAVGAAVDASPRIAAASMLALGLATAGAWLPTLQYDDLAYHLGLPSQLMRHGRYALDASQQAWALAPWAGDVLQGIAQVLAREEARGPVDAAWLIACAALVARIATRLGASVAMRWLSVALVATLPPVAALLGGMQTELPATAALLALVAIGLDAGHAQSDTGTSARPGAAVGALAGLLAGLKLMHPVAGAAAIAWAAFRTLRGRRAVAVVAAVVLAFAVAGSSYVQAWRVCGNPVLPLLNGMFRSPCFAPVDFADLRWQSVPGVPVPWSMTFLTGRHLEAYAGGLGFLLVALAGAAVAALVARRTRAVAACALVAIAVPMLAMPYARYVVPGLVLLVPAAVAAIARCLPERRALVLLAALCVLDLAFQANAQWMLHSGAIKRALAAGGRDAPLFDRFAPERSAIARLQVLAPTATVLDLGGAAHAELAGRGRTTTWYAPRLHAAALAADRDPSGAAWAALLRAERVDIVLLRAPDASPARRAGLARVGAHVVLTRGPVECWALPPLPTP